MGIVTNGGLVPDARARGTEHATRHPVLGVVVAIYCVNCGVDGGYVNEGAPWIVYLCQKCAETYGKLPLPEMPDPRI